MQQDHNDDDYWKILEKGLSDETKSLYSLSAAMAGIALACFTSIADACDHHKLMSTLSKIIVFSLSSSLCIFILGLMNGYRVTNLRFRGKEADKYKSDLSLQLAITFVFFICLSGYFVLYQLIFSVLELPLTPADALTFCEQPEPNKPDSK